MTAGKPLMQLGFRGALLTLALLGCSGDSGPSQSQAEGSWAGTLTGGAFEGTIEWTLRDNGGHISGNGTLRTAVDAEALSIEGAFTPPNLTLTIHSQRFEDFDFSGTVGEQTMKGRLNGSGFLNRAVTLDRQ